MFKVHRTYNLTTGVKNNSIAVFNEGRACIVLYHQTPVIVQVGKLVAIDNGGWDTISTRAVINRALEQISSARCELVRKRGKTYLEHNGIVTEFTGKAKIKVFHEPSFGRGAA